MLSPVMVGKVLSTMVVLPDRFRHAVGDGGGAGQQVIDAGGAG